MNAKMKFRPLSIEQDLLFKHIQETLEFSVITGLTSPRGLDIFFSRKSSYFIESTPVIILTILKVFLATKGSFISALKEPSTESTRSFYMIT